MFRKLTYLMMLILIGVGSAFGQNVTGSWRTGQNISYLVTIDQNLLAYKAQNSSGTVNVTINNITYNTYDAAITAVYSALENNATTTLNSNTTWNGGTVNNISVVNLNGKTVTFYNTRTVSSTLVLVGDGTVNCWNNTNRGYFSLSGTMILQGNVTLDGGGGNRDKALISGGGKLYMADNATIQKCINTSTSDLGGAVSLSGSNATLYMAGGVIGDNSTTDLTWTKVSGSKRIYKLGTTKGNSAYGGAGVYITSGKAYLNGGKIRGNYVQYNNNVEYSYFSWGGGMYAQNATIQISGTTEISFNLANVGGGLCADGGSVEISGGTFYNNRVAVTDDITPGKNVGGAIEFMGCRMNIHGGTYSYNYSVNTGGAFHMSDISAISGTGNVIKDVTVDHNYCYMNGIIDMQETDIRIASGHYHDNTGGSAGVIFHLSNPEGYDGDYTLTIGDAKNGGTPIFENNHSLGYDLDDVNVTGYGGQTSPTLNSNGCAGAITLVDVSLDIEQATFTGNTAVNNGGAIFVYNDNTTYPGKCRLYGGTFTSNKAGVENTTPTGGESDDKGMGGAIYVKGRNATLQIGGNPTGVTVADPIFKSNNSRLDGGAMYVDGGSVTMYGGTFGGSNAGDGNSSTNGNGGGIYVNVDSNTKTALEVNSGTFSGNKALNGNGGGFYVAKGKVDLIERTGQTPADVITINNVNEAKNGGGFFVNGGTITITGAEISGNKATANGNNTGNGGGVYSNGGVLTINNGDILSNDAVNGGGGYVKGGTLTINNGDIDSNTATDGAGFFVDGGTLNLYGGTIGKTNGNVASNKGGGFYIKGGQTYIKKASGSSTTSSIVQFNEAKYGAGLYVEGTAASGANHAQVNFENGAIKSNHAEEAGGGIYISQYATLTMTGSSEVTDNYVDQPGKGGGVYKTGETRSVISVSGNSLKITDNYVKNEDNSHTVNNLFLYGPMDFLTVAGSQNLTGDIAVGISIDEQTKPLDTRVIHGEYSVLNDIFTKMKSEFDGGEQSSFITDDAHKYLPLFAGKPAPYTFDYIFFVKVCYSDYPTVPASYKDVNPLYIHNAEELAYFTMIVNGINLEEGGVNKNPSLEAYLENDIVITETFGKWIPAGGFQHTGDEPYGGEFHGQGHTISGLYTAGLPDINEYGLFGVTSGAVIEDLNLTDLDIKSGESTHSALLIGEMNGGVVRNVVASGLLDVCGSGESSDGSGNSIIGGLVGELKNGGSIINSMAMAEINADFMSADLANMYDYDSRTVGGLVGVITNGTVRNSFANPKIIHGSWNPCYVGGLVAENHGGTIENCYVRLERGITLNQPYNGTKNQGYQPNTNHSNFGMFAGFNDGTIKLCYYPDGTIRVVGYHAGTTGQSCPVVKQGSYENTTCKIYHPVERPYTYDRYMLDNQVDAGVTEGSTLMSTLNGEVTTTNGYSRWMRTKASDVNDDYPVLSFDNLISTLNYTTIGSKKGYDLDYDNRFNEVFDRIEEAGEGCLFIYRTPWDGDISSPASEFITADNSETGIKVFVEDGVALLQDADSKLINTYTCHEFDDETRTWHLISSALNDDSPIGFEYANDAVYNAETNPCGASIATGDYASFFPQGITMADLDLYCFYEKEYHWINFKRRTDSHWHMNDQHQNIAYTNETNLVAGKGYLASFAGRTFVQAGGELTNGNVTISVTAEAGSLNSSAQPTAIPADEGTELKDYNLLGNPYQSYLDMTEFLSENGDLFASSNDRGVSIPTYAIYDTEKDAYVQGIASTPSRGSYAPAGILAPHEGFFIVVESETEKGLSATFTNAMRLDTDEPTTNSRAMQPAYPLVNLVVTDESGESDIAVAEFGRTQTEGAAKMKQIGADGKIYFHYADDDYALLYLNEDTDQLPVRFDAIENGTYTMTWSTANATFSYLHLVDNMTGIDVDMLSSDAYTFTASSSDYKSRFKLMFAYTGVEENEAAETETFAFMHDGALTVNGEGMLEVIDMSGRTIVSSRLTDAQNTVSLPQAAQGVYVLRLTNDNQSKVQKIVIE